MIQTGHPKLPEMRHQDEAGSPTTKLPGSAACTGLFPTRDRSAMTSKPGSMVTLRPTPTGRIGRLQPVAGDIRLMILVSEPIIDVTCGF